MYKSKLQELCHQRSWSLPEYGTAKEGPDHIPSFTGTVSVNGLSFRTPNPCKSSKEAQNVAAKIAFDHFTAPPAPPREQPRVSPPPPSPPPPSSGGSDGGTSASSEDILLRRILASLEEVQPKLPEGNESHLLVKLEKMQPELLESNEISKAADSSSIVNDNTTVKDMQHLYKSQLQTFAQKRNLALPKYSSKHEGPPHARRFWCEVSIDGKTYGTAEFYSTLKEAEHAAARTALRSLSSDTSQEVDCVLYKNLLQEFTQKQGLCLPVYNIDRCGESHVPIFVSTVEIEGESFRGQEAKTKKLAETSAAKVAYTILNERTSGKTTVCSAFQSPLLQRQKAAMSSYCLPADDSTGYQQKVMTGPTPNEISNHSGSDGKWIDENVKTSVCSASQSPVLQRQKSAMSSYCLPADDSTGYQQEVMTGPTPNEISDHSGSDGKQIDDNENVEASYHNLPGLSSGLNTFIPNVSNAHLRDPSLAVPSSSEDASSSSSSLPHSTEVVIDSPVQPPAELHGLSSIVVRVYPRESNMTFPRQRILLSDKKWVAVSADSSCRGHAT